jgi:hypothetical protein
MSDLAANEAKVKTPRQRSMPTSRPTNKKVRQYKFSLKDIKLVQDHLKTHGNIKKGDLEKIPWANIGLTLKLHTQLDLPPGPRNRTRLLTKETPNGPWLDLVALELSEEWLRSEMLKADSTMPLSRDAGYHWIKSKSLGISRRALWSFLEKQEHLQMTRNIPNERKKGGAERSAVGHVEIDLVHLLKGEFYEDELGELADSMDDEIGAKDGYIFTLVSQVTRYGFAVIQRRKTAAESAASLRQIFREFERVHKAPIVKIYSDQGKEFAGEVKRFLATKKVKHRMVARGAHIEHFNQVLQRSFYRCLNMERGSIRSCLVQALGIINNSFSRRLGMSPAEAVKLPLKEIQRRYNRTRDDGDLKYMKTKKPKVGDKCRVLVNLRKLIRAAKTTDKGGMYKTAKGNHFSRKVHTIKVCDHSKLRYYAGGQWRDRDELMIISGVDDKTQSKLRTRRMIKGHLPEP